ncbi:MAG: hypothetical protein M0Q37_02520 [Sphaerochaeta sp.]|jgi:predicted transcriptional regulator of viral defense system|nr:hypothetical protein [Sphaerochaeta sp.]
MLKTYEYVMYELGSYASPKAKLTQMIKKGEIIRIARGVYADDPSDPRLPVAGMLCWPSYVSFETALAWHGMIGERVFAVKSVGYNLKKEKRFDTPFGRYSFHYLPEEIFSSALMPAEEQGHGFRLATAEKALLDTLYKIRGIRSKEAIRALIVADLRLSLDRLSSLDWEAMELLSPYYHSTTIKTFMRYRDRLGAPG